MNSIVLIADNDVRCRRHLRRFFAKRGFMVLAAANGLECLDTLVSLEPDVLVVSADIPWGGGDGVIARLEDGLPVSKHPLVLVTGSAPAETLSEQTGVLLSHCFSKPLYGARLLQCVHHMLCRWKTPAEAVLA